MFLFLSSVSQSVHETIKKSFVPRDILGYTSRKKIQSVADVLCRFWGLSSARSVFS